MLVTYINQVVGTTITGDTHSVGTYGLFTMPENSMVKIDVTLNETYPNEYKKNKEFQLELIEYAMSRLLSSVSWRATKNIPGSVVFEAVAAPQQMLYTSS